MVGMKRIRRRDGLNFFFDIICFSQELIRSGNVDWGINQELSDRQIFILSVGGVISTSDGIDCRRRFSNAL